MKNKRNWMLRVLILTAIVLNMTGLSTSLAPTTLAQSNSAASSPTSVTRATDDGLVKACAEAVEELRAARTLLASQGKQIALQAELLNLEREISTGLKNIRTLDAAEKTALRDAITAKDVAIKELKKNQFTMWKKVKVFVIGAAAGLIIGAVIVNK